MPEHLHKRKHLTSFQLIILGFAGVILIGALILTLPVSSASGVVTPFDQALFTSPTPDTFCTVRVIHRVYFHLACFCTFSTVNALFHIYSIAVNRNTIKYWIKSSQRTDIFTKWTIYYNRKNYCNNKDRILPYKKPSDRTAHGFIQKYQRKPTFQRTCRTDQLAKIRCSLSHDVYDKHWEQDHKYHKDHIF